MWKEGKEVPLTTKVAKTLIGWFQLDTDKDVHIAEVCILLASSLKFT